jgi:hypothetical protein
MPLSFFNTKFNAMTLQEFYQRIVSIKYRTAYKKALAYFDNVKSQRLYLKDALEKDITYVDVKVVYNFLNNYSWELINDRIIIHFPEIVMDKGHVVRDLYFGFNPVYINDFVAARSTYTLAEYNSRYCHSHISFSSAIDFHSQICFGDTSFKRCNIFTEDVIGFLLYLDVYLKHEYDKNPYNRIVSIYTVSNNFYGNIKVNLGLFNYQIKQINGRNSIVPIFTPEAEKSFKDHPIFFAKYDGINEFDIDDTTISRIKVYENQSLILDYKEFVFNNQRVKLKIINNATEIKFKESAKQYLIEKITQIATDYYTTFLETHSEDIERSGNQFLVRLQENQ